MADLTRYAEVNAELRSLEGKNDPESRDRYLKLIDELMTLDMAMQPYRRAMGQAKKPEGTE